MYILVVKFGDNFEIDTWDEGNTFAEWCRKVTGKFSGLMAECRNRILLFDNRTKDETRKKDQVNKLLSQVRNLQGKNPSIRHTFINFEKAKALGSKDFNKQENILMPSVAKKKKRKLERN